MVGDVGARVLEEADQLDRRRLARVRDARLVRDAEDEDLRALQRALALVVQRLRDDRAAEVRHRLVDLPRELDELGVEAELARLPREVEGIDRDAVTAEAGPGLERHEAERLRRRRLDHLPHVDVHPVAQLRELVDERDVDRAEDVLEELRELGRLGRGDAVDRRRSRPSRDRPPRPSTPRRSPRRPWARSSSSSPRARDRRARARTRGGSPFPPSGRCRARGSAAPARVWCPGTWSTPARRDVPARRRGAICSVAERRMRRSGSRWREIGVGSATRMASTSRSSS